MHDFVHPSRSLLQVYEWSSERVKMRNLYHFFKAFLTPQKSSSNHCFADFLKKKIKLGREKVIHFGAIHILGIDFSNFLRDLAKNVLRETICEWGS